mmetsp:Transcript_19708/g.40182  ORF Transcript_19708/g.40182 Transcript_19708/m.40182 type:complete len:982 (+) Transcript_19708:100-3045(+)
MSHLSDQMLMAFPDAVAVVTFDDILTNCNPRFEKTVGPSTTLQGLNFLSNCIHNEEHARFRVAMARAKEVWANAAKAKELSEVEDTPKDETGCASDKQEWQKVPTVRSCRTLAMGSKGDFPLWRKLDWAISVLDGTRWLLSGRPSGLVSDAASDEAAENADKAPSERELLDFLNKAPIAMHWLSGTGHVLWANETEMNVLGYTPEEYIGQPIMQFCPDETPLVLEIFKTLGSGNTIKDVPVRFRAKNGQLKELLIDSNVNWNPDGSFKHTRCFIRDDTGRKIREARLNVAREKDREVAKSKDIFFRKIFHEIRTPSHLLAAAVSTLGEHLGRGKDARAINLFGDVVRESDKLRTIVEDAADASLMNLGKVPVAGKARFSVKEMLSSLCKEFQPLAKPSMRCMLTLRSGDKREDWSWSDVDANGNLTRCVNANAGREGLQGSSVPQPGALPVFDMSKMTKSEPQPGLFEDLVEGDKKVMQRVLRHLLLNAFERCEAGEGEHVTVCATYWAAAQGKAERYTFSVTDSGEQVDVAAMQQSFNNYFYVNQKFSSDLSKDKSLNNLGMYVSFNLVQCLGGTLHCIHVPSEPGMDGAENIFTFTVPIVNCETIAFGRTPSSVNKAAMQDKFDGLSLGEEEDMDLDIAWTDVSKSPMAEEVVQNQTVSTESGESQAPAPSDSSPHSGQSEDAAAGSSDAPPVGLMAELQRQPHVLVADRSSVTQKIISSLLKKNKCTVEVVGDGAQCLKLLNDNPSVFDAVVMDPNLPVMDGVECLRLLSENPNQTLRALPVIALASNGVNIEDLLSMGFKGKCEKPIKAQALLSEIDRVVQERVAEDNNPTTGETQSAAASSEPEAQAAAVPAGKLRCLIVEDNKVCQKVAAKMMKKLGFECETGDNGQEGLSKLKQRPTDFQFVLMDLRMPVMDGLEATKRIRTELGLVELPIVALTGELMDAEWSKDFHGVLNKPASLALLQAEVARHLPAWAPP